MAARHEEKIGIARLILARQCPYMMRLIRSLVPREVKGFGTIGVTDKGLLPYDPEWIESVDAKQLAFTILHEALHLFLAHHKRRGDRDPKQWNIAGDLAINPICRDAGLSPPSGILWPSEYKFADGLTADEYYQKLAQSGQGKPKPQNGKGGQPDPDKLPGNGRGKAKSNGGEGYGVEVPADPDDIPDDTPCKGKCGSGAGNKQPKEPSDGEGERSEGELDRAVKHSAEAAQKAASQGRGSVPAGIARECAGILAPPKVRWQEVLRRAARAAVAFRPGAGETHYRRPNRIQAGIGYGVGCPILPSLRSPVPTVTLALDTSGSVGPAELEIALRECAGVLKEVGGDVRYIACDASIHVDAKVSGWQQIAKQVKGGGGTDFRPIFKAIEKKPPDVLIVVTDGQGPAPRVAPTRTKVIWLLVGRYRSRPTSWGQYIEVEA